MKSIYKQFVSDPERARLFEQESLVLEVTEAICRLMEARGLKRADLAQKLGTSKANISQLLDGSRNMTLRTLADVACVMKHRATFQLEPATEWAESDSSSESGEWQSLKWNAGCKRSGMYVVRDAEPRHHAEKSLDYPQVA